MWNSDVFAYALSDKNRYVREAGIKAFQKKGSKAKDAEKALIRTLEHEQWHVRAEAAKALGFVGQSEDVISALIRALKDDHNHVRIAAVGAIGKIGPKSKIAVSALIRSIGDKNEFVRRASITAIGNFGPAAKEAVPVLVQALQGENSGRASTALGKIGSNAMEAVPALIKALEYGEGTSKDLYYRRCAAKALKEITKQNFGKNISLWKQWWKQSERH